jgi:CBS domain-containing protein
MARLSFAEHGGSSHFVLSEDSAPGPAASPLARLAAVHVRIGIDREACPLNLAPTASTTAALAMGDALAMALLEARGFTPEDFARRHPGGWLGKRLLTVREVMHTGEAVPRVKASASLRETIYEMSRGKLGIVAVTDVWGVLVGCLSDGDLRRLLERGDAPLDRAVGDCMKPGPRTIDGGALASSALKLMEEQPPAVVEGISPDPGKWADDLEPFVTTLDEALQGVSRDRSMAADTVEAKSRAMKKLNFVFIHGLAVLRGFFFLAGRPDLGKRLPSLYRVRKSRRGPNPREELPAGPEQPAAEEPPSTEEPPAEEPPL